MGVRSLRKLLAQAGVVGKDVTHATGEVVGNVLLVDAIAFGMHVAQTILVDKYGTECGFELGGPYRLYRSAVQKELKSLTGAGFTLRFFFDGDTSRIAHKRLTHAKRIEEREAKWTALSSAVQEDRGSKQPIPAQADLPTPYLLIDEMTMVLRDLQIDIIRCKEEADQDIARAVIAGNEHGRITHYAYSSDTDFLLFPNCPTIRLGDIEITSGLVKWSFLTRRAVAEALNLSESLLVELGILIGNDATSPFERTDFDHLSYNGVEEAEEGEEEGGGGGSVSKSFPLGFSPAVIKNLMNKLARAEKENSGLLSSSKNPLLAQAIEYSRSFYALEDLSRFLRDEEDEERSRDFMSLTEEQKEDIKEYTAASTPEIVTTCGADVIAYLEQAIVFEDQITEMHIEAYSMMQEALAEVADQEAAAGKQEHPLCPRPPTITWSNIVAAEIFQRTYAEFKRNSLAYEEGPDVLYKWDDPQNQPSSIFDGHLFHRIMTHLKASKPKPAAAPAAPKITPPPSALDILPIDSHRDTIISRITTDRVTIIHGETGCGKSSRLPAILLEHAEATGQTCRMFVSQPRRIAASSLMKRLRTTLSGKVGLRMGHGVIDETDEACITFVTTGYLVRLLANYPDAFRNHTHLIIDEVHERSVDGDVLCLLARRLLLVHPTIRLILMSATVHTELYREYFSNQGEYYGSMDVLSVGVRRFPVTIVYANDLEMDSNLPPGVRKTAVKKIVEFTTGRTRGRGDEMVPQALAKAQYTAAVALVRAVGKVGTGVLIFVSGINDIVDLMELFSGMDRYVIVPIHSDIPFEEQEAAFEPAPPDQVKVVIATNAAESSITLPDVDVVICLGTHKALRYNSGSHRVQLVNTWISKASGTQRAGRTGRVRPGLVFRLYSRSLFEGFDEHEQSEVHRQPLQDVILDLRSMLQDGAGFQGVVPILEDLLEPPDMNNVGRSFDYLYDAGMITSNNDDGLLTSIGRLAGALPVDLTLGRLIAMGVTLGVGTEAAILASALSQPKSLFRLASPVIHTDPDEYNDIIKQTLVGAEELDGGIYSEPIMMLRMFLLWHSLDSSQRNDWCQTHGLAHTRVRQFMSASLHLIERVNSALKSQSQRHNKRSGKQDSGDDTAVLSLDYLGDTLSDLVVNTLRLILTWTADGNLVRLNPQKKQLTRADFSSVTLTGESVSKAHLDPLFPPSVTWTFDNTLRRIFDAPLSETRTKASMLELLKDLAACFDGGEISNNVSAVVWIVQQMPPKPNRQEGDVTLSLAIGTGPVEFAENMQTTKNIFGISLCEGGSFRTSETKMEYKVYVVAMLSKAEQKALHSLHDHLTYCMSVLLPREGNAKVTSSNISPNDAAIRRIFFAQEADTERYQTRKISQTVQASKQIMVFDDPFKPASEKQQQQETPKGKGKKKGGNHQQTQPRSSSSKRPSLLFDVSLGIRLLNAYSAGYKDRKMRLWRTPRSRFSQPWRQPETTLMPAVPDKNGGTSSNPYHQRAAPPAAPVGSADWRKSRQYDAGGGEGGGGFMHGGDEEEKILMTFRTVQSNWTFLQLKKAQGGDDFDFRFHGSARDRALTIVSHSSAALMPRQSLAAVVVHCGSGVVWGVVHNTLFLSSGGPNGGGQDALVRCEGITLVPPGSRWLSLALQCNGMAHDNVELSSRSSGGARGPNADMVQGPHDLFLDNPISKADEARCKAFHAALCEHQRGPICQNDDLLNEAAAIFAPWIAQSADEANFAHEEGGLDNEYDYHMARFNGGSSTKSSSAKKAVSAKREDAFLARVERKNRGADIDDFDEGNEDEGDVDDELSYATSICELSEPKGDDKSTKKSAAGGVVTAKKAKPSPKPSPKPKATKGLPPASPSPSPSSEGFHRCLVCGEPSATIQLRNLHMMHSHPRDFNRVLKDEKSGGSKIPDPASSSNIASIIGSATKGKGKCFIGSGASW